jgi:hypothetical protein
LSPIGKQLQTIAEKSSNLSRSLAAIDIGRGGSAEYAGYLLEMKLADSVSKQALVLIPEFVTLLEAASTAAGEAALSVVPKHGPKGARGNAAFNPFIELLLGAARQKHGGWTLHKSVDGKWIGSLLEALKILEPYLPKGFFPRAELGRSVKHILDRYQKTQKT